MLNVNGNFGFWKQKSFSKQAPPSPHKMERTSNPNFNIDDDLPYEMDPPPLPMAKVEERLNYNEAIFDVSQNPPNSMTYADVDIESEMVDIVRRHSLASFNNDGDYANDQESLHRISNEHIETEMDLTVRF